MHITAKKKFVDIFLGLRWLYLLKRVKSTFWSDYKNELIEAGVRESCGEEKEGDFIIQQLKSEIVWLNSKIGNIESKMSEKEDYTNKMSKLYNMGIIDKEGDLIKNNLKLD